MGAAVPSCDDDTTLQTTNRRKTRSPMNLFVGALLLICGIIPYMRDALHANMSMTTPSAPEINGYDFDWFSVSSPHMTASFI